MGLADRFKDKLDKRDIFKKAENKELVTEPIENKIKTAPVNIQDKTVQAVPVQENIVPLKKIVQEEAKFEDLETAIIDKIRKTPYWKEYSTQKQENMISKYFDAKVKNNKSINIEYNMNDKLNFIKNILTLSNYR